MQQMVGRARSLALGGAQPIHRRLAGLDGLRAIAVIAVFLFHADLTWARGGYLGVDLFFVISGFLITGLLVDEIERTGRLSLGPFYLRRARRLLPASWLMMTTIIIVASVVARDALPRLRTDGLAAFFYVTNWELLASGKSYFEAIGRQPLFLHLWSLAIEEQFYIAWAPLVLLLATRMRGRALLIAPGILAIGSVAWMAYVAVQMDYPDEGDPTRLYFGTDTHGFSLLFGAMLGLVWRGEGLVAVSAVVPAPFFAALGVVALGALFALFLLLDEDTSWLYPWGFLLAVGVSATLIASATLPGSPFGSWLDVQPMRWIGERSYGIYLWHWPIFMLTRPGLDLPVTGSAVLALRVGLTLAAAGLSYRFIETPIRQGAISHAIERLREEGVRRWAFLRDLAAFAGGAGVMVLASAILVMSPHQTAPSRDVLDAIGTAKSTSALHHARKVQVAVALPKVTPKPKVLARNETFTGADLTAIGDSVLLGASRQLLRELPGTQVYATVGWQARDVLDEIQSLHDDGDLTPVILIHTGTNGYVTEKQLRKMLGLLADRERVLLINTHVPRRWMDENNDTIDRVLKDFPNAALVDWRAVSDDQPKYFVSDGVHLTISGQRAFVAEIVKTGHFVPTPLPVRVAKAATGAVSTIDPEDDTEMAVSYPPLMPTRAAKAAALAVALATPLTDAAPANASAMPGSDVPDLACPATATPKKAAPSSVVEMPSRAELGDLVRPVVRDLPAIDPEKIPDFALNDASGAARPRSIAFWGDSHIAAGPMMTEIADILRARSETVGMRFLPPTMGRTNVRLPIRAYCIGRGWTTTLAYRAKDRVETGPALVTRSAVAGADAYLWVDLRNAQREATLRGAELVYRPGADASVVSVSINDGPEQQFTLATSSEGASAPSDVLNLGNGSPVSTIKLRVAQGHLDLFGFVLDYETPPEISLDIFGVPSSEATGWANADPSYLVQALHGVSYDAVVLEYGTNEGNDADFSPEKYAASLRTTLTNMRTVLPRASCVLMGPPDRGVLMDPTGRKPDLLHFARINRAIADTQSKVGADFGCVSWDWQDLMGGQGGAYGWAHNSPPLMGADLTHLTPEGYRRTADALAKSLGWGALPPATQARGQ
jgi:peptidoglycan/LPS O-acetylase OafA/YrhL/lysophospholipase L1-like esterase